MFVWSLNTFFCTHDIIKIQETLSLSKCQEAEGENKSITYMCASLCECTLSAEARPINLNCPDRKLLRGLCSDLALYITGIRQIQASHMASAFHNSSGPLPFIKTSFWQPVSARSANIQLPAEGASITVC